MSNPDCAVPHITGTTSASPRPTVATASTATGLFLDERLLLGIIMIVVGLVYAATLGFGFVWDDHGQITENPLVRSWRFVPQYFRGDVWQYLYPGYSASYYRPLNVLWFRINDALFGPHAAGWHATAVLLHVLAVWLVYVLARRLTGKPLVAAFSALLFGVHPMRHEVVGWISGTTESLWSVTFLAAFLAYLKSRERTRWAVISCALYGAALLAKETAIMLPAIVFVHAAIYARVGEKKTEPWRRRFVSAAQIAAWYIPVAVIYLAARISALHGFYHPLTNLPLKVFLFTLPSVLFFYMKQWFFPVRFGAAYDLPLWQQPSFVHVILPLIGILAIVVSLWFFRRKLGEREVMFSIAWVTALLLPALDLPVFQTEELVHDRYFYLPSFGICLLAGLAMERLNKGATAFGLPRNWLLITLALLVPLSYATVSATAYWANDYSLFEHAYGIAPRNSTVRISLAQQLVLRGDYDKALPMMEEQVKEQPNTFNANYVLGHTLYDLRQLPAAEHYLETAKDINPAMPYTYFDLGLIDLRTGRTREAEANMRQAVALRRYEPMVHFGLASMLAVEGKCEEARAEFHQTLELQPDMPHVLDQMENCGKVSR